MLRLIRFKLESLEKRVRRKLLEWLLKDGLPEVKVGKNTVAIDGESITLASLATDPTLAEGKLFFRGDLDELRFSPDGSTVKVVHPATWDDITNKPSAFPPEAHTHTVSEITDIEGKYTKAEVGGKHIWVQSSTPTAKAVGDIWIQT